MTACAFRMPRYMFTFFFVFLQILRSGFIGTYLTTRSRDLIAQSLFTPSHFIWAKMQDGCTLEAHKKQSITIIYEAVPISGLLQMAVYCVFAKSSFLHLLYVFLKMQILFQSMAVQRKCSKIETLRFVISAFFLKSRVYFQQTQTQPTKWKQ